MTSFSRHLACGVLLASVTIGPVASAADPAMAPRQVPAKTLAVPTADVSPAMQKFIAAPLNPAWNDQFSTGREWRKFADHQAIKINAGIPDMMQRMDVTMAASTIDGVRVWTVTPNRIAAENQNRVLLHEHGGCYVLFPGETGATEAIMMAGYGHIKVVMPDYRMPPEAYFPAPIEDSVTVYKALTRSYDPKNIGIFGTSAGGALTLEIVLRLKQLGMPLPGALGSGTPMSDAIMVGDSFYTNKLVDNVLVSPTGFCQAATVVYAKGHSLKDPLISPVYGDMHGFPPTILTSGTRDLLLSNTVRVHRALHRAGVVADLEIYEGQSHAQYQFDDRLPEAKEAFTEIGAFFDKYLGKAPLQK